jgi:hypothetical protein
MEIEKGTQIGSCECPSCGAELPLKVNAAGGVYYYCAAVLERDEETGKVIEKCMTRLNFGRVASRRMKSEFLKTLEGSKDDVKEHDNREESPTEPARAKPSATDRAADSGDETESSDQWVDREPELPREQRRGFGAAVKHFLTADE